MAESCGDMGGRVAYAGLGWEVRLLCSVYGDWWPAKFLFDARIIPSISELPVEQTDG